MPPLKLRPAGSAARAVGRRLSAPISALQIPVLLLWGAEDTWVPASDGEQLESLIANAQRVTLDEVGHLPMHEAPERFKAALLAFLQGG